MIIKKCRVCGKEYSACKNAARNPEKKLRWQEFACSTECGNEYFAQIRASRNAAPEVIDEPVKTIVDNIEPIEVLEAEDFGNEAELLFGDFEQDEFGED